MLPLALGCTKDSTGYPKSWPNEEPARYIRKTQHHQAWVKSQTFDPTYCSSCTNLDKKDKAGGQYNRLCKVLISDIFFFYVCHFHCLTLQTLSCSLFPQSWISVGCKYLQICVGLSGSFCDSNFCSGSICCKKNHFCRCQSGFWAYWMEGTEIKTLKWWRTVCRQLQIVLLIFHCCIIPVFLEECTQ